MYFFGVGLSWDLRTTSRMTARRSTTSHIRCLKHPGPYLYRLYSLRFPLLPTDFTPPQTANWLRTGRFQRRLRPSREPGSPRNATRQVRSISWYGKRGWWPVIVHLCRCGASARARKCRRTIRAFIPRSWWGVPHVDSARFEITPKRKDSQPVHECLGLDSK